MRERIVENWLTRVNERGLEVPFCQLLTQEGASVLHLTRHGPAEQGKDVIAVAPDRVPEAYQLKVGDISLSDWRSIKGQVDELVSIKPRHPSLRTRQWHRAYLVTTGELAEEVRRAIVDLNQDHLGTQAPLGTIVKGELLSRFLGMQGDFWPADIGDFSRYLGLLQLDGADVPPLDEFAAMLASVLPFESERDAVGKTDCSRAMASALVLTAYVTQKLQEKGNHVGLAQVWTAFAAHTLGIAERHTLGQKYWKATFDLATEALAMAFGGLIEELDSAEHLVSGDPLTDCVLHRARVTALMGHLAAYALSLRISGAEDWRIPVLDRLIGAHAGDLDLWGESAIPLLLAVAWYCEWTCRCAEGAGLISRLVGWVLGAQRRGGLPGPHYSMETCLGFRYGLGAPDEALAGRSFGLRSLVEWLTRRLHRRAVAGVWGDYSRVQTCEFVPRPLWRSYLWRSPTGEWASRYPEATQSWALLKEEARAYTSRDVPGLLQKHAWFLPLFLVVYPHRLRPALVWRIDQALDESARL